MGKNSKARRDAKKKHQARSGRARAPWTSGELGEELDGILVDCAHAVAAGNPREALVVLGSLSVELPPGVFFDHLAGLGERAVDRLWERGWQPDDLGRVARRRLDPPAAAFVLAAAGSQSRAYAGLGAEVAPDWMDELARIGAVPPQVGPHKTWGPAWAVGPTEANDGSVALTLFQAVEALALLLSLPPILPLGPSPRAWRTDGTVAGGRAARRSERGDVDAKVLAKVRALLSKAESTEFEEEANALTAKAQELITRHRIDRVLLDAGDDDQPPAARRLGVDDPYAGAKALLLSAVACANGCNALWTEDLGCSTVFGDPDDLDTVELLYTSLLVQATTALRAAGANAPPGARSRSRSFRQSFLVGYASRIRTRLEEGVATATTAAEEELGRDFLPVLVRRREAVDDAAAAAFPKSERISVGARDGAGWLAGHAAAELADITTGRDALAQPTAS